MRRHRLRFTTALIVIAGTFLPAANSSAWAQNNPQLDIRIEEDTRPRTPAVGLGIYYIVTLTDRATGQAPDTAYAVFAQAMNNAGEKSEFFECDHASDTDSRVARGIYNCYGFISHGGPWEFVVFVNEPRTESQDPPVTVARASLPFEIASDDVYVEEKDKVTTSASTVIALWVHVMVASIWFVCVAALATLALPQLRRRVSSFGLKRLESRSDALCTLTWSATAGLIGTGVYLLLNETAYETPFTPSKMDAVLTLPYARLYFFSLAAKVSLYAMMLLAVIPLMRGARQQLHRGRGSRSLPEAAGGAVPASEVTLSSSRAEGTLLTATATTTTTAARHVEVEPPGSLLSQLSVGVLLVGALGISIAVTLMKYFHQVIEALP